MKYIASLGVTGALVLVMLAVFLRAHSLAGRDVAVLTGGVASMAADWEAKKVPLSKRVVNLVIADSQAGEDPYEAALPQGGLIETAGGWVNRNLIGGGVRPADADDLRSLGGRFHFARLVP